ncbi:MAG: hypothetical protein QXF58_05075 [Desulfurococcaceae archaeon]
MSGKNGFEQVIELLDFLDSRSGNFPREVSLKRRIVRDEYELYEYWERNREGGEAYMSVYSYPQIYSMDFNHLFVDLDFDGGIGKSEMTEIMMKICANMSEKYDGEVMIIFTGSRGYHLYLKPKIMREMAGKWGDRRFKAFARRYIYTLLSGFEEYVDARTVGDYRRMARMCGSKRAGGMCEIMMRAEYSGDGGWAGEIARSIWESEEKITREIEMGRKWNGDEEYPPCLVKMIEEMVATGELDHYARFTLAAYFLNIGWDTEDVIDIFKAAGDYNERYTRYQVEYIKSRGLRPFNCANMATMGYCPGKCQLYPYMLGRR